MFPSGTHLNLTINYCAVKKYGEIFKANQREKCFYGNVELKE